MAKEKLRKIFLIFITLFTICVVSFYFLAGDALRHKKNDNSIVMPDANAISSEINKESVITQSFISDSDSIKNIEIVFTKNWKVGSGELSIELLDEDKVIANTTIDVKDVPEQHRVYFEVNVDNVKDKLLTLRFSSTSEIGEGVCIMMNHDNLLEDGGIKHNDDEINGVLCFSVIGEDELIAGKIYWIIMGIVEALLIIALIVSYKKFSQGKATLIVSAIIALYRYSFLISQLVERDFKIKYKRSVLGVLWSFLNPLLTMSVQYFVFSTLFGNDDGKYPAYLLIGTIMFSFFSECTAMCLTSISGNANLINKVYVPKYIYPFTRTLSSLINFTLTLLPTVIVCLICGILPHKSTILFLYFVLCLIIFTFGVGLLLASMMVFFRDIQFLWSVLTTIWMYATPIFYSAEIIPTKFRFIVQLNPLYHFIGNARTCIISGVSPDPMSYIYCLIFALGSLAIGSYVFKKTQDKFTLYL